MTKKIEHLESLCVIHVDFDIWSGQTRLSAEDFRLGKGGKLPSGKVAKLGSKHVCDPATLKGFQRLKTETRRLMLRHGMPFMSGFAVPTARADIIIEELGRIADEFAKLKRVFLNGYHSAVESWIQENPEEEEAIRVGVLPLDTVEKRIGFEYQVFMIQPLDSDGSVSQLLDKKVQGLGGDLLDEVAEEATSFFSRNLSGREECGISTRNTLVRIRDKIDGLSFLNSAFIPLVSLLDETVRGYSLHAEGRVIKAPFFYQVVAATLILSDRKRIEEYASGAVTLDDVADSVTPMNQLSRKDLSSTPKVQTKGADAGQASTSVAVAQEEGQGATPGQNPAPQEQQTDLSESNDMSPVQQELGQIVVDSQEGDVSQAELDALDDDLDRFFGQATQAEEATAPEVEASQATTAQAELVDSTGSAQSAEPATTAQVVAIRTERPETTKKAEPVPVAKVSGGENFTEMPEIDEEEDFFF